MITAPYNFVPLNKEVFYPPWADDVSHDIPFEDGESGEIDITITAKSPIFIRDNLKKEEFCQYNGEYYIPGSSIKGMVRNVLEIMSFSKMRNEIFDDNTYAVRDLSEATNFYMQEMKKETFAGWLRKVDNAYIIEDCGEVGRIRHEEIDKALNVDFSKHFKDKIFDAKNSKNKTSEYKYNLIKNKDLNISLSKSFKSKTNAKYDSRVFYNYEKGTNSIATLVLTGQPTPRKDSGEKGDGKGYEFLFFSKKAELKVEKEVVEKFKFAYFDKRKTEPKESPDWTYWKEKLKDGERIPVFFQRNGLKVKHFGLSYLYKLPYSHSIKDGIPRNHFESKDLDLSQIIFGFIDKKSNEALKGRVNFSHFKAISNIKVMESRTEILGTPRASYYPNYILQKDGKLYSTYMDSSFEIAGRKRYPIHSSNQTTKTVLTENENVGVTFSPLKDGIEFSGKLRYHNLKKAEIGALLSVLTFHNTPKTYHNIGMAKSLGYGKIEIKLNGIANINSYLKEFELTIGKQISNWALSPQIEELLAMASEQKNEYNSTLKYMSLTEFAGNKTGDDKDYLKNYTALDNIKKVYVNSLISDEENKQLVENREKILAQRKEKTEQENREKKEREEALKKQLEEKEDFEKALKSEDVQYIESIIKKYPQNELSTQLQTMIDEKKKMLQQNKFSEVNQEVQKAWDNIHNPQYKAKLKGALDNFIKKWEMDKNNKGSEFVLELVQKAKDEFKKVK
ncbi:MAG: TIGR03986 family CRISPR-associated RAMP protein [Arcobacteraceae bacterium]